jgi:hypothetical protein
MIRKAPEEFPHFTATYAEYYKAGTMVIRCEELSDEAVAPVNCALSQ